MPKAATEAANRKSLDESVKAWGVSLTVYSRSLLVSELNGVEKTALFQGRIQGVLQNQLEVNSGRKERNTSWAQGSIYPLALRCDTEPQ